ncbi:PTS sugar transporter subunit IIA [Trinickia sp. EG282A]|uniref:PTS sugar transporter subunit IIA n=1 Tax=Trinickia sp. EG282A TaxID=3237013 RepID=UPI0034D19B3F
MRHRWAGLAALLGKRGKVPREHPRPLTRGQTSRNVMMRVTLDAQHATPVRQALIRDCLGQPWTIRITPLAGTTRVRLSLYLPRTAINGAMRRVADLAPTAELGQLLDVPETPTGVWRDLLHPEQSPRDDAHAQSAAAASGTETIARLISDERVLLGLDVADRDALFTVLGHFVERYGGLPAATVAAGLSAREALGSTGLGRGIAVPHAQAEGLREPIVLYVRPREPIPFEAPDDAPVTDVVALFVPEWANTTHLHLLADVAERFCDHRFRERLQACDDARAVCRIFQDYDRPQAGC